MIKLISAVLVIISPTFVSAKAMKAFPAFHQVKKEIHEFPAPYVESVSH